MNDVINVENKYIQRETSLGGNGFFLFPCLRSKLDDVINVEVFTYRERSFEGYDLFLFPCLRSYG